jgi:NAD(P)-dependent dehydrogenase (short-subunit alcohol dehydrogenase family)
MKIIVIGSTGTIGSEVVPALSKRHEVIGVHRKSSPVVDIERPETIDAFLSGVKDLDAIVCCAGSGAFKPLVDLSDDDIAYSLRSKLAGQVAVIRHAVKYLRDGGSVTVTTGTLAQNPMAGGSAISMINAGLEGFVRGAALDAPRGIRVNAVSPPWLTETLIMFKMDSTHGMPAADAAKAYVAAVEGTQTGQILDCTKFV